MDPKEGAQANSRPAENGNGNSAQADTRNMTLVGGKPLPVAKEKPPPNRPPRRWKKPEPEESGPTTEKDQEPAVQLNERCTQEAGTVMDPKTGDIVPEAFPSDGATGETLLNEALDPEVAALMSTATTENAEGAQGEQVQDHWPVSEGMQEALEKIEPSGPPDGAFEAAAAEAEGAKEEIQASQQNIGGLVDDLAKRAEAADKEAAADPPSNDAVVDEHDKYEDVDPDSYEEEEEDVDPDSYEDELEDDFDSFEEDEDEDSDSFEEEGEDEDSDYSEEEYEDEDPDSYEEEEPAQEEEPRPETSSPEDESSPTLKDWTVTALLSFALGALLTILLLLILEL